MTTTYHPSPGHTGGFAALVASLRSRMEIDPSGPWALILAGLKEVGK